MRPGQRPAAWSALERIAAPTDAAAEIEIKMEMAASASIRRKTRPRPAFLDGC